MRCWLMKSEPDDVSIDALAARPGLVAHDQRHLRQGEGQGF